MSDNRLMALQFSVALVLPPSRVIPNHISRLHLLLDNARLYCLSEI